MATGDRQLVLDLPLAPASRLEDFLPAASNRRALDLILAWPAWPGVAAVVDGAEGAGKSHLAAIWLERSAGVRLDPTLLWPGADPLARLGAARACCIEDADRVEDEELLFHLYNLVAERGGHLLLTARQPLAAWPLRLPDLRSRLRTALTVPIMPPDEHLLAAVLVKQLADRGLTVAPEIVEWLVRRCERSFRAIARLAAELDLASLRARRPITLPLARAVLEAIEPAPIA
jgi:DnaA regulatory inactivator Hda